MKAMILSEPGAVSNLVLSEEPVPVIADGEVLVSVKTISINPVDAKTRAGKGIYGRLKTESPLVIGWDISGVVTESKSPKFNEGDHVFGMVHFPGHGKAYAEYVAAPAAHLALKPENVSHEEAAAATLAALTALQTIRSADLKPGDRVLIQAASGGVGHFAVQIAKQAGAYVIGTSSAANADFVLSLGADEHIDYAAVDVETVVKNIDFVLDTVGGEIAEQSLAMIKPGGKLISIPGTLPEAVVKKAAAKNIDAKFMLVESNGDDMAEIAAMLENRTLASTVSLLFAFEQLPEAHTQIEGGRTVGKIVVSFFQ